MNRTVGCKNLGVDCSYGVTGINDEEVLAIMYTHIQNEHPEIIQKQDKEALMKMIEEKIHDLIRPVNPIA